MIHGGAPAGWLEFSANLNPLGTPPAVAAAVATARYDRYSDLDVTAAEAHLAADAGVPPGYVLLTAGATEAIRLVATTFGRHRQIVVLGPTYTEYARAAVLAGSPVISVQARQPCFRPPVAEVIGALAQRPSLVFACDPNNPTGRSLSPNELEGLMQRILPDTHLVVDQSFAPFATVKKNAAHLVSGGVILVRSLTKSLAAPGLRIGYVIAAPRLIVALRERRDPWSVGAHAVAATRVVTWDLRAEERQCIVTWRTRFISTLSEFTEVLPSDTNFLLARFGPETPRLVAALARQRIAVRDCASFGLPEHIRLAVRPPAEQDVLLAAIARCGLPA